MTSENVCSAPSGRVCGGGLLSRHIFICPVCGARSRQLTQHSFGGYVITTFCGKCGSASQDGEVLDNDPERGKKFVRENWKHGQPLAAVINQITSEMMA